MESLDILELIATLNSMIKAEQENISELSKLLEKADHIIIKFIAGSLIHDSEKHMLLHQALIDILKGEVKEIGVQEKMAILNALDRHMKIEEQAMKALESIRAKIHMKGEVKLLKKIEQLLNLQAEEEKRHHKWFKEV
ncbi:MAG: hypothetical protein DRJ33_07720, partial [Candidatus Methanomethylicota archaeon]